MENMKFSIESLGTARILPGAANLASKCDCSNDSSFQNFFFQKFSKKFTKFETPDLMKRKTYRQRIEASRFSKYECSNHFSFRDMTFFFGFFKFFRETSV